MSRQSRCPCVRPAALRATQLTDARTAVSAGKDVWGDRAAADRRSRSFTRAGWTRPRMSASSAPRPVCRPAFAPQASPVGSSRRATPTSPCSCATPASPVSAARFADTGTPAAPVLLSQERCKLSALRVILANSGCANAATGRRGLEDAAKTQGAAAMAVGVATRGGPARIDRRHLRVPARSRTCCAASARPRLRLRREGDTDFQQAIQTTDAFEKRANLSSSCPRVSCGSARSARAPA